MIPELAARLKCSERSLRAILRVECGSDDPTKWLGPEGRPIIRVEAHHIVRAYHGPPGRACLRVQGPGLLGGHQVQVDGVWSEYHGRQERERDGRPGEWDAFDAAKLMVGGEGAIAATSWGCAQVMGMHWRTLGLPYPLRIKELASTPEGCLDLLERYLRHVSPRALQALQTSDWIAFARAYNGDGPNVAFYAGRIADAAGTS